ncbi:MAG: hypothetical protein NTX76_05065 [Alphaproteobacteria bacterium]|nr:hypothetical protein [Alphaproteobacteria bacterium]
MDQLDIWNIKDLHSIAGLVRQQEKVEFEKKELDSEIPDEPKNKPDEAEAPKNLPPDDGLYEIRHNDGLMQIPYKNKLKDGVAHFFDQTGARTSCLMYVDDKLHGQGTHFYPDGTPEIVTEYVDNMMHGPATSYYPDGAKRFESMYAKGKLEGEFVFYDEYGDVCQRSFYKNGVLHGPRTTYFPKAQGGGVCEVAQFENGLLTKNQDTFYSTGELRQSVPFEKGSPLSYPTNFDKLGKPIIDPANRNVESRN